MSAVRHQVPAAAVLDTSVLLRLLHPHDDDQQAGADKLCDAFLSDRTSLFLLDLSVYEFTNVLVRWLGRGASAVSTDVENLFDLDLPSVTLDRGLAAEAAWVAARHGVSAYDGAFVAAARRLGVPLLTADRVLAEHLHDEHVILLGDLA